MGVKQLWRKSLGEFRDEDRRKIDSLPDKRVVIDTSAWVHKLDGVWEVQYARTSSPRYPHQAIRHSFSAKVRALTTLKLHPIFVFDGISPCVKKRTNRKRQEKSVASREKYHELVKGAIESGREITDEERKEILSLRRGIALPTPEDYASLWQWMEEQGIECVQAPFEADAQMKQIILEGRASAAITEDGDLVVFEIDHILSQTKIDTLRPANSTCQYFELDKLGQYQSPIAEGLRSRFLPEISCFSGNDYINNLPSVGPATIFGTGGRSKGKAVIDSFIERTMPERQWLEEFEAKLREKSSGESTVEDWSADRFIQVRNLIRHYPVFKRDPDSGAIQLLPLTPIPSDVAFADWGSFIGFDKHPSLYFSGDISKYYSMEIVGSKNRPRSELLGPRYTAEDNPHVDPNQLLPLFARVSFDGVPVDAQPSCVLKWYLLARGVPTTEDTDATKLRELVKRAIEIKKIVLDPGLAPKPVKWVGFEPLDELELGDCYDDWNGGYVDVIRSLKTVTDSYVDHHFGTECAQYERVSAFALLEGGNIGLCTVKARNVKSELRPGKKLIAFSFKCLSSERSIVHSVYMVFEQAGAYVPSPASFCTCENGAFFCSHMLCFFYVMRLIQVTWSDDSQGEIETIFPLDRRLVQNKPCLLENVLARGHIQRQKAQSCRLKRQKTNDKE